MPAMLDPLPAQLRTSRSRWREGIVALAQCVYRYFGVDDALALHHAPDGVRQVSHGSVLGQEAYRSVLHRALEVAGAAEGSEDDDPAGRQALLQPRCRGQTVLARHLDVQEGDVGTPLQGEVHDLVASTRLRHDLDIGLEPQKRGYRPPDHGLVLGDEYADHPLRALSGGKGRERQSRKPPPSRNPASSRPPKASALSLRPARPVPRAGSALRRVSGACPSSMISIDTRPPSFL